MKHTIEGLNLDGLTESDRVIVWIIANHGTTVADYCSEFECFDKYEEIKAIFEQYRLCGEVEAKVIYSATVAGVTGYPGLLHQVHGGKGLPGLVVCPHCGKWG